MLWELFMDLDEGSDGCDDDDDGCSDNETIQILVMLEHLPFTSIIFFNNF